MRERDNTLCLTVLGRDQPGIVAGITRVLYEQSCNLRETSMTILGSQCALLVIVHLPRTMSMGRFEKALEPVKKQFDLSIFSRRISEHELTSKDVGPVRDWSVTIYGNEQPGIVHDAAQLMADHGVTITELKVRVISDDVGIVSMRVRPPRDMSMERLRPELERLGLRYGVEVRFR